MNNASSPARHRAFVALGANLDDPAAQIRAAATALGELPQVQLLRLSSLYRTAPVGVDGQPDFINAVAVLNTSLTAHALLAALLDLEAGFGRSRAFHHAPRTLDLDLLLFDEQILLSETLKVPHPRMHLRAFVLVPLLEIAADCRIPGRGNASAWAPAVSMQRIERLS